MIPGYISLDKLDAQHQALHRKMFSMAWPIMDQVATSAPTRDTLPPGHAQIYQSGATTRIYFNVANSIFYWALTAA